jgi:hypothetical protein
MECHHEFFILLLLLLFSAKSLGAEKSFQKNFKKQQDLQLNKGAADGGRCRQCYKTFFVVTDAHWPVP